MLDGKKSTAERIVYDALAILAEKTGKDPVEALEESIKILTPALEVRSRRVGGATYQVPVEVPARRARTLAVRWLVEFSRNRREKQMSARLGGRAARRAVAAGRRLQAQGRHLPHGAGKQGVRALPLVDESTGLRSARPAPRKARQPSAMIACGAESDRARLRASPPGAGSRRWRPRPHNAQTGLEQDSAWPRSGPFFCPATSAPRPAGPRPARSEPHNHHAQSLPPRKDPQHRDHGAHRRRQDDDDRAHPLLHRAHLQDR